MPSSETILLDHGAGGRASQELIEEVFAPALAANPAAAALDDAAVLEIPPGRVAVSTDSFVVDPPVFPGGSIGSLAVHGTVNDIAMRGARPLWLTAGFVLEEGLELSLLKRIVADMAQAAAHAGVIIVAGDTKVVGRGQADKVFINTAGIGVVPDGVDVGGHRAAPGDLVIVSGNMGDHGVTIMACRQGLGLDSPLQSDSAALNHMVAAILAAAPGVHVLRDPTRGGLATTLNEIARSSAVGIELDEATIPVDPAAAGVCELLGLDPLYLANEGKLICIVPEAEAEAALAAIQADPLGARAARVGRVIAAERPRVWLQTAVGGRRILDMLHGEPLPRIC